MDADGRRFHEQRRSGFSSPENVSEDQGFNPIPFPSPAFICPAAAGSVVEKGILAADWRTNPAFLPK
jgi:hypothetical protein